MTAAQRAGLPGARFSRFLDEKEFRTQASTFHRLAVVYLSPYTSIKQLYSSLPRGQDGTNWAQDLDSEPVGASACGPRLLWTTTAHADYMLYVA